MGYFECKFPIEIVKCTLAHIFSQALRLLRVRKLRDVSCDFATRIVFASYANFLPPERITLARIVKLSVLSETSALFGRRALPTVSIFASFGLPATQTSEGTSRAKCENLLKVTTQEARHLYLRLVYERTFCSRRPVGAASCPLLEPKPEPRQEQVRWQAATAGIGRRLGQNIGFYSPFDCTPF